MYDEYGSLVLHRLFTRRWLGALAGAVVFAVACWFLGQWQYGRHVAKVERNERIDAHYEATPVPATDILTSSPLPLARQWTHVTATGSYADDAFYVRNRPNNDGVYGYEILVPFVTGDGAAFLVDRGWVKNSDGGANVLPDVPPAPSGEVTLTGWTIPGERSLGRELPAGQLASINVAEARTATGIELLDGYVRLDQETTADGAEPPRPQALGAPDKSLGPHLAYAWNWWLVMPAGFLLVWLGIRREERDENPDPVRVKKTRIWDEEDE